MFTSTNKMKGHQRVVALVYGQPKIGKTSLTASLPGKPLIVNLENGLLSLQDHDIDVYDCTIDANGVPMERHHRFEKLIHLFKNELIKDEIKKKYNWIVIDSLTEVAQCLVEAMKIKHPDGKDALKLWGEYSDKMMDLVKQMRDFRPYNVLFLALEQTDKDENSRRFVGVDLNGKISQRIPALVDEVFHYRKFRKEDGTEVRKLVTSTYENAIAGDRSGKLSQFEDPDMGKIVRKILEKENSKGGKNV